MLPEFWGVLHDGGIDAIDGQIPGDLTVAISIQYLRQQFPGEGEGFTVKLRDCSRFEYLEYDGTPISDLATISGLGLEIISFDSGPDPVVVGCVMGTLTLSYGTASVFLDSGEPVSQEELVGASRAYWDAWSAANK